MRSLRTALAVLTSLSSAQAVYPTPGLGALAPVQVHGMTFVNYWMPAPTGMKSRLQDGLELFANSVAGTVQPEHERKAGSPLLGPLKWLMTYDDALKTLPAHYDKGPEQKIVLDCFPKDSLTSIGFHVNFFEDRGHRFDWMYFVLDKQRRLVGVELVATSPKDQISWVPGPHPASSVVGRMEPYYDYINMKNNASTTQQVEYEIAPADPGVKLIHTALFKGPRCLENVHWYLAGPFARALLEIIDAQHRQGR